MKEGASVEQKKTVPPNHRKSESNPIESYPEYDKVMKLEKEKK